MPSWKHNLELGARRDGMIKYDWAPGMPFLGEFEGGRCFPQVFSAPIDGPAPAMPSFTDDAIFAKEKKSLFQLVVVLDDLADLPAAKAALSNVDALSGGELSAEEATFIVHDFSNTSQSVLPPSECQCIIRVLTAPEYISASALHPENAIHRPAPHFYNPNRIRDDIGRDKNFAILRPDRFIFAACRDRKELEHAAGLIPEYLKSSSGYAAGEKNATEADKERFKHYENLWG